MTRTLETLALGAVITAPFFVVVGYRLGRAARVVGGMVDLTGKGRVR